jgi:hypothetical protein
MWRRVVRYKFTDRSVKSTASIFGVNLSIYDLFNYAVSSSDKTINEIWIGKDVEESASGICERTILTFAWSG